MTELPVLLNNISVNEQLDFCITRFPSLMGNIVYGYLFESLALRDLDVKYLNNDGLNGFFAKCVLNSIGIDTSRINLGIYQGQDVDDICRVLQSSDDPRNFVLAHVLKARS